MKTHIDSSAYLHVPLCYSRATRCRPLQTQTGVHPGVWERIKNYFESLNFKDEATKNRSRLTELRAQIVNLESAKQRIIDIVEAHIEGSASGIGVSKELRLSEIPAALVQIDGISDALMGIAKDGDLFAAENSFKELKLNLHDKRFFTLCQLGAAAATPTPDVLMMKTLVQRLKDELRAISAAEDALAKYIKKSNK